MQASETMQNAKRYTFVIHPVEFLQAVHSARQWSIVTVRPRMQPRLHLRLSLPRIPSRRRGLSGRMLFATVIQQSVSCTGTTRYICEYGARKNRSRTSIFPRWLHDATPNLQRYSEWLVISIFLITRYFFVACRIANMIKIEDLCLK